MRATTSPFFTVWPSEKSTSVMTPLTCGRSVTVVTGVTVPSASMITGMSARLATAMPTVTVGPALAPRCLGPHRAAARHPVRPAPGAATRRAPAAASAGGRFTR
ncbi:hypothetical protein [Variovorax sp. PAMC 28711]|uniref:hypothetical protein n=1 Tax=Variovorax sp. PAMC 28711 TaxID=1795631 RepID=UPI00078EF38C|nr:hypothetical protein AX767_02695 [Variovorax sp. PAMC 28711]